MREVEQKVRSQGEKRKVPFSKSFFSFVFV